MYGHFRASPFSKWPKSDSPLRDALTDISQQHLARYAKHNGNFVLVVSGSLEAERTKKLIEIVYDLLIKAIELGSFALLKFGVRAVGLK